MSGHRARAQRHNGPGGIWFVRCPGCPAWCPTVNDKLDADRVAAIHNWTVPAERRLMLARALVERLPCHCWHGDEQDPKGPCLRCRALTELGDVAA